MTDETVAINVTSATTKANWVLVASGDPLTSTLYQTDDEGEPTTPIENIELIFPSESDDDNIFKATIPVISGDGNASFSYKKNNPINFTNTAPTIPPGLSCVSLIALSNGRQTLKLAFKCVLGEDASLTFNVRNDETGDHFISLDPRFSLSRRPR